MLNIKKLLCNEMFVIILLGLLLVGLASYAVIKESIEVDACTAKNGVSIKSYDTTICIKKDALI